jgi:hypothetical protein
VLPQVDAITVGKASGVTGTIGDVVGAVSTGEMAVLLLLLLAIFLLLLLLTVLNGFGGNGITVFNGGAVSVGACHTSSSCRRGATRTRVLNGGAGTPSRRSTIMVLDAYFTPKGRSGCGGDGGRGGEEMRNLERTMSSLETLLRANSGGVNREGSEPWQEQKVVVKGLVVVVTFPPRCASAAQKSGREGSVESPPAEEKGGEEAEEEAND